MKVQIIGSHGVMLPSGPALPGAVVEVDEFLGAQLIESWKQAVPAEDDAPAVVVQTRDPKVRKR